MLSEQNSACVILVGLFKLPSFRAVLYWVMANHTTRIVNVSQDDISHKEVLIVKISFWATPSLLKKVFVRA